MELSPRVSEKKAAKWLRAIAQDLLPGETVLAVFTATRMKPATVATVITNLRILGISHFGPTVDKRLLIQAHVREIRGFSFPSKWTGTSFVALTDRGEVDFGTMPEDEAPFARQWSSELTHRSGGAGLAAPVPNPMPANPIPPNLTPPNLTPANPAPANPMPAAPAPATSGPPKVLLRKQDGPDGGLPLLTDELRKLALLHERGVLDDEEFTAAKRAVITRHS